jgi:hypothetical protein
MDKVVVNNETKYKLILIEHFPSVIVDLILSYMNKYNVRHIEDIIVDDYYRIFIRDNDIFVYKLDNNTLYGKHKTYKIPKNNKMIEFIDDERVLLLNYGRYHKILNIQNSQIIDDLQFIGIDKEFCTHKNEYMVFKDSDGKNIFIFDVINKKLVCNIAFQIKISHESLIIDNMLFITGRYEPIIFKYSILGEHIQNIHFENRTLGISWFRCYININEHEIILTDGQNIIFYDLDGCQLNKINMNMNIDHRAITSSEYVHFLSDKKINKYKRVL